MSKMVDFFDRYYNDAEFIVNDIKQPNTKFIFVLESPQDKELELKLPLVGPGGLDMARFYRIGDNSKSIGEVLNADRDFRMSVINVSRVPLLITEKAINTFEREELGFLRRIEKTVRFKSYLFGHHDEPEYNDEYNAIEQIVLNDFIRRFNEIDKCSGSLHIVLCGRFVRNYYKEAYDRLELGKSPITHKVPNPSKSQWIPDSAQLDGSKADIDIHLKKLNKI